MKKYRKVAYFESPGKLILIEHPHRLLVLYGKNYSKRAALHLLIRWVKLNAHYHLTALLKKLNRRVKANYKKLIIRSQEAQWGSYSSSKTLSLNYKLIFLPPSIVRYVILHELCHTRYLEHSPRFWKELAKYDKNWKANRKAINDISEYLPPWLIY